MRHHLLERCLSLCNEPNVLLNRRPHDWQHELWVYTVVAVDECGAHGGGHEAAGTGEADVAALTDVVDVHRNGGVRANAVPLHQPYQLRLAEVLRRRRLPLLEFEGLYGPGVGGGHVGHVAALLLELLGGEGVMAPEDHSEAGRCHLCAGVGELLASDGEACLRRHVLAGRREAGDEAARDEVVQSPHVAIQVLLLRHRRRRTPTVSTSGKGGGGLTSADGRPRRGLPAGCGYPLRTAIARSHPTRDGCSVPGEPRRRQSGRRTWWSRCGGS
mmetsp:Transcript_13705/g.54235  ORF Transcript_13705/g.54235 Transcript_13705/m.54235 type:complete len:272 (+) Transcript_13705:828-1643(+)